MRSRLLLLLLFLGIYTSVSAQLMPKSPVPAPAVPIPKTTNQVQFMEMEMGDTIYLLKKYFLCLLRRGPVRNLSQKEVETLGRFHQDHLKWLGDTKKLCMAGLMEGEGDLKEMLILSVISQEEAEYLIWQDPAVRAGRFTVEVLPWWGPVGSKLY